MVYARLCIYKLDISGFDGDEVYSVSRIIVVLPAYIFVIYSLSLTD
jgi:hypothetical protein